MEAKLNEVTINGTVYVPKSEIKTMAVLVDGMQYVMVRTYTAGVFAGYLKKRDGKEITLLQVRRIWYWDGAASLSQLALDGTSKPENCKFPEEVSEILLTEAIEIIPISEKAKKSIDGVKIWKK